MSIEYQSPMPVEISESRLQETFVAAMQRVYLWMAAGLFLTAAVAWFVIGNPAALDLIFGNSFVFFGLIIGELLLVIAVTAAAARLSAGKALALFFFYAALNGATMAVVFLVYTASSIALAFGATAVLFAFMAFIGLTTKQDLTRWGPILFLGLIGLILGSVVNVFLANSTFDWIITYAGIGLFLALTVYDSQRIKDMTRESLAAGQADVAARIGVVGALRLYLDFINLLPDAVAAIQKALSRSGGRAVAFAPTSPGLATQAERDVDDHPSHAVVAAAV